MEFFKNKHDKNFGKIAIEKVSHPSSAWWNKSNGIYGRQKFEDLLRKYWIRPIDPIIREQTCQLFYDLQTNPFWNKEIWDEIRLWDEKHTTCAFFDNKFKNISIDIYCAENDKYQFQIFERDKFKTTKPSGVEWIQNISNLTAKGSRYESELLSLQDLTYILKQLMK
jgi:hypothetical protein